MLLLCVLPSCGTAFRAAWKKAPASDGVSGKWDGAWNSEATGHHGRLRCVVSAPLNAAGDREFFYHATWMGFLSGCYKATHQVQEKGGAHVFKGEHRMPDWAGGLYHYEGVIRGDEFKSGYKSSADHGTYVMKRVR